MARTWPIPEGARSIHVIGDIHFGVRSWGGFDPAGVGLDKARWDMIVNDCTNGAVPTPYSRVCIGDITDDGGTDPTPLNTAGNQDVLAIAQIARLPAPTVAAQPTQTPKAELIGGNHDVNMPISAERGTAAFETAMGIPQSGGLGHYAVDLGFVRCLYLQQPRSAPGNVGALDAADQTWLDNALTAAGSQECWIFYHYPLLNTVGGIQSGLAGDLNVFSSFAPDGTSGAFSVNSGVDTSLRTMLGTHSNAKAWISGHTHSPFEAPGLVTSVTVGTHVMACINVSAVYYTRRTSNPYDPVKTVFITKPRTGANRIELRYRNHGAGIWDAPQVYSTSRLASVTL